MLKICFSLVDEPEVEKSEPAANTAIARVSTEDQMDSLKPSQQSRNSQPLKTRFSSTKYVLIYTHVLATASDSSFKNKLNKLKPGLYSVTLSQSPTSSQWTLDSDVKLCDDNDRLDSETQARHELSGDRISDDGIGSSPLSFFKKFALTLDSEQDSLLSLAFDKRSCDKCIQCDEVLDCDCPLIYRVPSRRQTELKSVLEYRVVLTLDERTSEVKVFNVAKTNMKQPLPTKDSKIVKVPERSTVGHRSLTLESSSPVVLESACASVLDEPKSKEPKSRPRYFYISC